MNKHELLTRCFDAVMPRIVEERVLGPRRELLGKTHAYEAGGIGFYPIPNATAADVIRRDVYNYYLRGSRLSICPAATPERLALIPCTRVRWVFLHWADAARWHCRTGRYDLPDAEAAIQLPNGTEILARDGEGRLLVLLPKGEEKEDGCR